MMMLKRIEILPYEYSLLQQELNSIQLEKDEIKSLGLIANEQGGETFGHDNPILEAKAEKQHLLNSRMSERKDILLQIAQCFIVTESSVKQRKDRDKVNYGEIRSGLGSIYTLRYAGQNKEIKGIITGCIQGRKVEFDGQKFTSISPVTELWKALLGKSKGDIGEFMIENKRVEFSIIDIE